MGKKEQKLYKIIADLKDVRRSAIMTSANFSDELKEETKLYRQTWLIEPLDSVIENLEEEYNNKYKWKIK